VAGKLESKVAFITGAARGQADVRDYDALKAAVDDGVAQLGRLDIVSANAGIFSFGALEELEETTWRDMIDTNLTGVLRAVRAGPPGGPAHQGGAGAPVPGARRPADPMGGAGRHLQRGAVAGLRRVPVRHRDHAAG
jgi:NAD(P)-dependent dehydrogenase (short-subunit alcohol dehydrogenase family)